MTYDGFDFEAAICNILPGHGAIMGGKPGPIPSRDDFEKYPWKEIPMTIFLGMVNKDNEKSWGNFLRSVF